MTWNWQHADWPNFQWDQPQMTPTEEKFFLGAGVALGTIQHLGEGDHDQLIVETISAEALTTSAIEGEILSRASVQSSIQRQLGLAAPRQRVPPAEQGIAEMMVDLYRTCSRPLSSEMLFAWHRMMTAGRRDLTDIGRYRTSGEPMQVVSGYTGRPKVHFEAPPAKRLSAEMKRFIAWFNRTAPHGATPLPPVTRAGIAHLFFESIHPFEDGNGRIGRAIAEKALAQSAGQPLVIALATTILAHRRAYYIALERANKQNDVAAWLKWFAGITLEAQQRTIAQIKFLIAKTKLLDRLRGDINDRQLKALLRMFREGPGDFEGGFEGGLDGGLIGGFRGGMSAGNYSTITGASPATTTRDLADLTEKGALVRTGERKHARYALNLAI
jgi:Fic family protein